MAMYTPEQQREISARYPGLQWVNGQPMTRSETSDAVGVDAQGNPINYLGQPATVQESLTPSHTDEGGFPWWALALATGAPAGVAGIGALAGGAGAAGAASAAPTAAASLPMTTAVPAATMAGLGGAALPMTAAVPAATMAGLPAAPAARGGWASLLSKVPGGRGTLTDAGAALGSMASASTANRAAEDSQRLLSEQMRDRAILDRERLNLDRGKDFRDAGDQAYQQALRAALFSNFQPMDRSQFRTQVPDVSFIKGGIGAQGQQAMDLMNARALRTLMAEEPAPLAAPDITTTPTRAGVGERVLGPTSLALRVLGQMGGR